MNEQQMADLAAYYASLPLPENRVDGASAPVLVTTGDPSRLLTPCASCHGAKGQGGNNETSALAGQGEDYLVRAMEAFKTCARDNDAEEGMSQFAHDLSEAEIRLLADYYSGLPVPAVRKGRGGRARR